MDSENALSSPIQFVKGVGPKLAKILEKKGIATLEDALYFIPRAYEDRRVVTPIPQLAPGVFATVVGTVVESRFTGHGRRKTFDVTMTDGDGKSRLLLHWFHGYPSLKEEFAVGARFRVYGQVQSFRGLRQIVHPDYELLPEDGSTPVSAKSLSFGRVVPIYSEGEGLHQKTIRKVMGEVLKMTLDLLDDPLPPSLRERLSLPLLKDSFVQLHFPKDIPKENEVSAASKRIIFEEFFVLQLGLTLKKLKVQRHKAPQIKRDSDLLNRWAESLPFKLTKDQRNAINQIIQDLERGQMMTRLVQGDVGSGKTVVALAAALLSASQGYQTALMVPTEILALQHFQTAEKLLKPFGVEPILLVSASPNKKEIRATIEAGRAGIVIGTHALFQEDVNFNKLGLVVVDEQHRFGVDQRTELVRKGEGLRAHLLMMTATPIPRTLAFTLYGDLDLTVIREKPANRQKITTKILREFQRPQLYQRIRQAVAQGEQVYIIYPLVEQSEKLELKSATEMYESLRKEVFPELSIALLHGRMKAEEKSTVLRDFKDKKYQILVSTTVIEVGIDVPNATLMVIEHPERLGLSQLHQLRGRVGRGSAKSECLLIADKFVTPRLRVMERSEDGFVIAEEDLKIRGPGEFLGTRQSGLPGFRVGHILRDAELLELARFEAEQLLSLDAGLKLPEHQGIRQMLETRWGTKIDRLQT